MSARSIVEIVGLIAVVLSLIFVGYQLRQDHSIARSEMGSHTFDYLVELDQTINSPEFAPIYSKMLSAPNTLSQEELIRINAFYSMVSGVIYRECYLAATGVFVECENAIRDVIRRYFGNEYAKSWWKRGTTKPALPLPDWVDCAIENAPIDDLRELQIIHNHVKKSDGA